MSDNCPIYGGKCGDIKALLDRIAVLEEFVCDLNVDGCTYGDGCPLFVKLNHGECLPCKARRLLEAA